ncbi:hypothetical protein [Candidatus Schmidhempelia bombi]|uniref:Uncharacterized protein n=1 Tax=Candidatus Schmidhempelia bombi str. Bimp TaxID=1387197 RepID=A0AB94IAM1_9GAMM|nr:hypothetical protein [Candidatus Schmidhempelia bombi]TEA26452.1 hypothetical protein O970_08730 [Candidatus Schmidhempelia bombi str. Bimp]
MLLKKICIFIIIYTSLSIAYCYERKIEKTWYFYKISKSTAYGETAETRDNLLQKREDLIEKFANTSIKFSDKTLAINDECLIEYSIKSTTPEVYWKSDEKNNLYKKLFTKEKSPLNQEINIITYLHSKQSCSEGLNNFIKNGNDLVAITEEGYLIFFTDQNKEKQLSSEYRGKHEPINLLGHPMIKDKNIIDKINDKCNFFANEDKSLKYGECETEQLSSYYARILKKIKNGRTKIYQNKQYEFYLVFKEEKYPINYELIIEKDNHIVDSLVLYTVYSNESEVIKKYYYIDEKLENIWLLNISSNENSMLTEKGTYYEVKQVDDWNHYQIDKNRHFKLLESLNCNYKYESPNSDSPTSWVCH